MSYNSMYFANNLYSSINVNAIKDLGEASGLKTLPHTHLLAKPAPVGFSRLLSRTHATIQRPAFLTGSVMTQRLTGPLLHIYDRNIIAVPSNAIQYNPGT
jgi:hypothetical protein